MNTDKKPCPMDVKMRGSVTVGPKGQVVIPKEVRQLLGIKPGDSLVTITKGDKAVGMVKAEDIQAMMDYIQSELQR